MNSRVESKPRSKLMCDIEYGDNNEHMTAHTVISTILFKWQTTESHYRALASAITQNMKPVA